MSSFSFLSDAFPNYLATDNGKGLFEDFTSPQGPQGPQQKKVTPPEDHDLLMKDLDHRVIHSNTTNKVPEAFDASSDYFKILASKWEPTPKEQNGPTNAQNGPKEQGTHVIGCMNVAEHIDKCSECRIRLEQIFRKLFAAPLKLSTQVIAEPQPPKRDTPVYLEIALLLLLGIFIVFVLDAFVRLDTLMDTSVFIQHASQPLLVDTDDEYELLDDDDDIEALNQRWILPGVNSATLNAKPVTSLECALDDIYRLAVKVCLIKCNKPTSYYWARGFNRFVALEIGQMIIWTWLVLFCVFLGTCIDYNGIIAVKTQTSLWTFVTINTFGQNWFFILSLVLYGIYFTWRNIKLVRDIRRMWKVRTFYKTTLGFDEFDLRTIRWADVLAKLVVSPLYALDVNDQSQVDLNRELIASRIVAKENWFKKLLDSGHVDFVFKIDVKGFKTEVCMLTRGLQWNLMYCVINFFFGTDLRLRDRRADSFTRLELAEQLSRRILILAIINIILLPFLVIFVALYAVFRYGEEFYKDPGNLTARQWSLAARWYFRDTNEMPHVLEERLRLSTKYAVKYTEQFSAGFIEGIAKAVAFVLGSFVMWMLIVTIMNEQTLLMLTIAPGKALIWFITVFSGIWVLCRGVLKEQHIFYPKEALEVVAVLVRRLPEHFLTNPGSANVLSQFQHLFPLRVTLLLMEFAGVIITPWILLFRVRPKCNDIVNMFCGDSSSAETPNGSPSGTDFDASLLQSAVIVENIRRLEKAI